MSEGSSLLVNVLASGMAGIIARVFTHPLDTAKARLQAVYTTQQEQHYRGTVDVLRKTLRTEGIQGFYRGFGAVLVGGTPGTAIYLCGYEAAKKGLAEQYRGNDFVIHFTAGMIAETLACIIYVPVDVVKERMQVQHKTGGKLTYRNSWDALQKIAATEGLTGIYKGYAATLGSFGPFSALYFVCYERFKYWTRLHLTQSNNRELRELEHIEVPFHWLLVCSSSAGALASWVTSPLDMVKLRLQVQRGMDHSNRNTSSTYNGVWDCWQKTYRAGGLAGLWRGAGARVLYTVPATTITMTSYETCQSIIAKALS
ncbi:hypothetical protein FisN_12Hh209 [Fistulifera solaris]|uniref:Uncharacterized protein n=1 Tax=Fistulifera solaris TaxID=1519565 RepID=A0A1Z5KBQ9_FISSO|nr:hypothetical protein FisN_12Hh209 [Fistulifera solaris]|eukprot:GAX23636.1 hypothetical protein FisN_12Hh209 [Fistulifera solaris]